jgi:cullin 3
MRAQVDGGGQTRQKVEEDRKHIIEAAIVRIMKARRVLDYNSIITEVTRQMSGRFVPVATDVKKRIESLIEREFVERDSSDRKMYRYLA